MRLDFTIIEDFSIVEREIISLHLRRTSARLCSDENIVNVQTQTPARCYSTAGMCVFISESLGCQSPSVCKKRWSDAGKGRTCKANTFLEKVTIRAPIRISFIKFLLVHVLECPMSVPGRGGGCLVCGCVFQRFAAPPQGVSHRRRSNFLLFRDFFCFGIMVLRASAAPGNFGLSSQIGVG